MRIFRMSPFSLISPFVGLTYVPVPQKSNEGASLVIWSEKFCDELSHLITHPIWPRGDIDFFTAALQYAVICRTDDRRRWKAPRVYLEGGPMLSLLNRMNILQAPLPISVHQMHINERKDVLPWVRCSVSNLLIHIGDTALKRRFEVYGVTTFDLRTIREAIDTFDGGEIPLLQSTKDSYRNFLKLRNTHADMPDTTRLAEFHKRAWLDERRTMAKVKRLVPRQTGTRPEVGGPDSAAPPPTSLGPPSNHRESGEDVEEDLNGYFSDEA
ncbi:hypothetical protein FNAPI_13933 [Fusarium napiforme]|uniref:Uncharacterized protein n=1 Tax=Fusarium napiforme TaxID=42672 RepID=A0A8H5I7N7_9HYPO|nr:hypothetical protein FNAPI_13933 [Fusarium napiforme]